MALANGSCLCGTVRFEVEGDFSAFYLCHCVHCRKDTGSAHAANLFAGPASLRWLSGTDAVRQFQLPQTRHARAFCGECGSALPLEQAEGAGVLVPAGSLDSTLALRPTAHIFCASRASWDRDLEQLPCFPGSPAVTPRPETTADTAAVSSSTAAGDARRMARSGFMALSGRPAAPALCPVPLASVADRLLDDFRALCGREILPGVSGASLLTERAAITGSQPQGSLSHNGYCRLLPCADGMLGANLPRDSDWELLPAWLESEQVRDWEQLAALIATRPAALLVARARLLGLAVVDATQIPAPVSAWNVVTSIGERLARPVRPAPRVVDLSSLWAGPLCTHLWQAAGADVTKVESLQRPDGARAGSAEFFALLNQGKHQLALPLHNDAGRAQLRELIRTADIVVEASRPRALRQMGLVAEDILAEQPGLTWLSITGYGRAEPQANWIAYGDDAAIAAGLSAVMHAASGDWLVVGDAIADPLSGLHAALAGWAAWREGGGQLVDIALVRSLQHCIAATAPADGDYRARYLQWQAALRAGGIAAAPPGRR